MTDSSVSSDTLDEVVCGKRDSSGKIVEAGTLKPRYWSEDDTDETIAEAKADNHVFVETCLKGALK